MACQAQVCRSVASQAQAGSAVWPRSVWPCVAGWALGHWMLPTWWWYRKTVGVASDFGKPAQETEEGNQVLQAGWLGAGL